MIGTPRLEHSSRSWSIRGLFTPTFWPKNRMHSVCSKSSRVTVPTGTPRDFFSPTEVLSWHMLELSGRFWLPYIRAIRAYM